MSDQGSSYLAQGCTQCGFWHGNVRVRAAFVIRERFGHRYWTCPVCEGSYGEVDNAGRTEAALREAVEYLQPRVGNKVGSRGFVLLHGRLLPVLGRT